MYAGQWLAGEFSTSQANTITGVQGWIGGGSGTATVAIYSDGGNVPGSELYSAGFTVDTINNAWYGASGLSWALGAGTYWAAFEVRAGDTLNGWMIGDAPSPLANYSFTSGGVWNYVSGVNVGVRVIPEPDTWFMLLAGLGMVGFAVRNRAKTMA